jgi:hypothetical protein
MKVKAFELRDRGTFVPAIAIKLEANNDAELFLLRHAGYGPGKPMILLGSMNGGMFNYDAYDWGANGTKFTAHQYIEEHFDELESGQVICTEYIRGERETPKVSERTGAQL